MANDQATDAYLRTAHDELCSAIFNAETADEESDLLEELAVIEYALLYGGFRYRPPGVEASRLRPGERRSK